MQMELPFPINMSPQHDMQAPYRPPYSLSPNEDAELQSQLDKVLYNGWI